MRHAIRGRDYCRSRHRKYYITMADEIIFIDKDPEAILTDTVDLYQQKAGVKLNEADPERLLIDCMGYREVLLRNAMEYQMRQNFVQLAEGAALDYWGGLFGITRANGETDADYRVRILAGNTTGIGTKQAYQAKILLLADVADVLVFSKNDDNSLLPGQVRIIPIEKVTSGVIPIDSGIVHTPELETEILEAILVDDFGVVGNVFIFTEAVPVAVDGSITLRAAAGYANEEIIAAAAYQIDRYFGQLSLSFAGQFGITSLNSYLSNIEGLQQVLSLNFPDVPVLVTGEFYQKGVITVNVE